MEMAQTKEARIAIAAAKAVVIQIAEEIKANPNDDQANFEMLWKLGNSIHQRLEDFRIP